MLKVVSNTTPILSLLKIKKLNILKDLYGEVIIPNAVFLEFETGINKPYYTDISKLEWVDIRKIKNIPAKTTYKNLGKGESEVLTLAKEINADLIIMDELTGRQFAKQLDIKLTGTIGILLKAKEVGLVGSIKQLLVELIDKGTWIHPSLFEKATELAGEP
jgi:predicted nucleic acid-binding protein